MKPFFFLSWYLVLIHTAEYCKEENNIMHHTQYARCLCLNMFIVLQFKKSKQSILSLFAKAFSHAGRAQTCCKLTVTILLTVDILQTVNKVSLFILVEMFVDQTPWRMSLSRMWMCVHTTFALKASVWFSSCWKEKRRQDAICIHLCFSCAVAHPV